MVELRLKNGRLAVQWQGNDKKFYPIPDDQMATYLVYLMLNPPTL